MKPTFNRPVIAAKYNNQNFIAKYLVDGFMTAIDDALSKIAIPPTKIIELGAGEGHVAEYVQKKFPSANFQVTDIYQERLELAKKRLGQSAQLIYKNENILDIDQDSNSLDLVICCEVLEHIDDYPKALEEIYRILKPEGNFVFSVPQEPLWRILNMARFKYLKDFGNTPTHVNHWSTKSFIDLIEKSGFQILHSQQPLPWTVVFGKKAHQTS